MRLGEAQDAPSAWPRVALYPTRTDLENMLGYPVADTVILMNESESDGYLRAWRPQLLSPDKHLGYAAQWFAIALALIVIYVVVNLRRPEEDVVLATKFYNKPSPFGRLVWQNVKCVDDCGLPHG